MNFANVYIQNNELSRYTGTQEDVMKHFCGITLNHKIKARQVPTLFHYPFAFPYFAC